MMEKEQSVYTFCRIVKRDDKEDRGQWFFKPSDYGQIKEHWEIFVQPFLKEGLNQYVRKVVNDKSMGHFTNSFAKVLYMTHEFSGKPLHEVYLDLCGEMLKNRLTDFDSKYSAFYGKTATIFLYNDKFSEIAETVHKDRLVFPDDESLNIDDVRYIKWFDGTHWYAKLGRMDILDSEGNQKWNTKDEAIEAAKWFITNKLK